MPYNLRVEHAVAIVLGLIVLGWFLFWPRAGNQSTPVPNPGKFVQQAITPSSYAGRVKLERLPSGRLKAVAATFGNFPGSSQLTVTDLDFRDGGTIWYYYVTSGNRTEWFATLEVRNTHNIVAGFPQARTLNWAKVTPATIKQNPDIITHGYGTNLQYGSP